MPATELPAVDHCRLLAMVKINTVDRAVKSLDRICCKDEVTNSASSPQGKREDGTYSTRSSCRRLEKGVCHPMFSSECIQVQKELMEKTSLLEAPRASFSAWRPVWIGN